MSKNHQKTYPKRPTRSDKLPVKDAVPSKVKREKRNQQYEDYMEEYLDDLDYHESLDDSE